MTQAQQMQGLVNNLQHGLSCLVGALGTLTLPQLHGVRNEVSSTAQRDALQWEQGTSPLS